MLADPDDGDDVAASEIPGDKDEVGYTVDDEE